MKKDDIRRTVRARKSLLTENEKAEAAQSVFDPVSYTHLTLPTIA